MDTMQSTADKPTEPPVLAAHDLTLRVDGALLLDHVSVQLHAGELLGIVGPNGAGKSTLLKILAGVRTADSGELRLADKAFAAYPGTQRARMLAYLEQRPVVHWPLSVRQVVALGRLPHGALASHGADAIDEALAYTDTAGLQQRAFHTLSEGEKMRVNLARVLATRPQLILADEPTAALDPWHQLQMLELLQNLARGGMGVMLVLHDLGLAARFCQRLLLLDQGRVVASGPPERVLTTTNLAGTWHIDAQLAPDTLSLLIRGRLA